MLDIIFTLETYNLMIYYFQSQGKLNMAVLLFKIVGKIMPHY